MSGHGPHADVKDPFQKRVAIMLAMYTALLAFTTMLTNESRTRALLLSNEAANQWSYFQAKSTKGIVTRAELEILERIQPPAADDPLRTRLAEDVVRYDQEKAEIEKNARAVVVQQTFQEHKEHWFEYASTIVELGIVLAGVSLLLTSRGTFWASVVAASISLGLTGYTSLVLKPHEEAHHATRVPHDEAAPAAARTEPVASHH